MNDDLNKAEQEWANRSLFRPRRRRRGRLFLILMLTVLLAAVLQYHEEFLATF